MPLIYDVIHRNIYIDNDNLKFIDNCWMKRLKRVKQLGLLDHVFPSASHTRFEHAIGVYHLATKYISHIEKNSELQNPFTTKEKKCLQLAALFHDLGHGPFSHVFDNSVTNNINIIPKYKKHEGRSLWMIDKIFTELQPSGFNGYDIDMIKNMIEPSPDILYKNDQKITLYNVEKPYLYQLINNKTTGLDVDKFDYLQRDTYHIGLDYSFCPERIFHKSKICPKIKHIIYDYSIRGNIYDLFHTRYKLHRDIYNHKTVKIIELMLGDALILSKDRYNFTNIDNFIEFDDSIYNRILYDVTDEKSLQASNILKNIDKRNFYKIIFYGPLVNDIEQEIEKYAPYEKLNLKFNFCNFTDNPLNNIVFYNRNKFNLQDTRLEHKNFNEELVLYYKK